MASIGPISVDRLRRMRGAYLPKSDLLSPFGHLFEDDMQSYESIEFKNKYAIVPKSEQQIGSHDQIC